MDPWVSPLGRCESNKPSDSENRAVGTQAVGKGKRKTSVKSCIRKAIGKQGNGY